MKHTLSNSLLVLVVFSIVGSLMVAGSLAQVQPTLAEDPTEASPGDLESVVSGTPPEAVELVPAEPADDSVIIGQPELLPEDGTACVPACIGKVDMRPSARRFIWCHPGKIETTLIATNPADCCSDTCYSVPVCIPACCEGEPLVCPRRGFLGRGVVEFCWPCGWQVHVVFRHRGDVLVRYNAD